MARLRRSSSVKVAPSVRISSGAATRPIGPRDAITLLAGLALLVAILLVRPALAANPTSGALATVAPASADAQLDGAADALEAATKAGGRGYRFAIIQVSTIHARPGGPLIPVPDPVDRFKTLGFADTYFLSALIERGIVTPEGFWMEMRSGPTSADGAPDFAGAAYQFGAIVKGGTTYRNDGAGWYPTDRPPGIGLDPRTAALLPTLLRDAGAPVAAGVETVDGKILATVAGNADVADVPGIVAVDGEAFTELLEPVAFSLDDQGRLAKLRVVARNTNLVEFDLVVETVITFDWDTDPGPIPDPSPALPAGPKG